MNSSNLPLLQPLDRYRPIRTRRTRTRFPEIIDNTSNINYNTYYSNNSNMERVEYILETYAKRC